MGGSLEGLESPENEGLSGSDFIILLVLVFLFWIDCLADHDTVIVFHRRGST